ncbi:MAG: anti-sigma factor, partial [Ilumatobacteraceae bacterium]
MPDAMNAGPNSGPSDDASNDPHDDLANEATDDERTLAYLRGEHVDDIGAIDPFDRADLDVFVAMLSDPATWSEPPLDLGDRVVRQISDVQATTPAVATAGSARDASADRRPALTRWIGPALLGAAAASAIAFAMTRDDGDSSRDASAETIEITGTELMPDISGSAEIESRQSGLWIQLELPGLPRRDGGNFYEAWLRSEDGHGLVPIGTFHDGE